MSKSLNSPTARLLQSSRLFSLPRPLPPPQLEDTYSVNRHASSPTATTPYPTRQAITTPASSLYRGDWGLKRPLPAKSTQNTSTPHIRVKAQDNTEHITAFESAADHTRTLAKWNEMNLAISANRIGFNSDFVSAYDQSNKFSKDQTDTAGLDGPALRRRWKKNGPAVMEMQSGAFEAYIEKYVVPRKEEFMTFLQKWAVDDRMNTAMEDARAEGIEWESEEEKVEWRDTTRQLIAAEVNENFAQIAETFRHQHSTQGRGSPLSRAIVDFLDLADNINGIVNRDKGKNSIYRQLEDTEGARTTHPGAGLSYARTDLYMENHPLYGPQNTRSPVLARVLLPRQRVQNSAVSTHNYGAVLGVGGVVARDKTHSKQKEGRSQAYPTPSQKGREYLDADTMSARLDPDLAGGNKYYVEPTSAYITSDGRVELDVKPAMKDAAMVKMGLGEEIAAMKRGVPKMRAPQWSSLFGSYSRDQSLLRKRDNEDTAILRRLREVQGPRDRSGDRP